MASYDYEQLAGELLRALRGKRSQVAFSRRLKYKSNVAYLWESGRNWPTAAVFLWAAERVGVDVTAAMRSFFKVAPGWLDETESTSREAVAFLLSELRGDTPLQAIAERTGRSRYAVSRWLKGETEPRLPDFLRLLEATSQRLLDFLSQLVDLEEIDSAASAWRELRAARDLVTRLPWASAVLLLLQTVDYLALKRHDDRWVAQRLGLSQEAVAECMELLVASRQIRRDGATYRVERIQSVDTRHAPGAGQRMREWWAQVGLDRIQSGLPGVYSFNVFSVSQADYERLQEMQRNYFRSLRAIVAASEPEERVVVTNLQIFALDER